MRNVGQIILNASSWSCVLNLISTFYFILLVFIAVVVAFKVTSIYFIMKYI